MRVLLVEDDPTTQQSIKMMLESAGMVVDATDLGEDGLEIGTAGATVGQFVSRGGQPCLFSSRCIGGIGHDDR